MKINEITGYKGYYLNLVSCKGDKNAILACVAFSTKYAK